MKKLSKVNEAYSAWKAKVDFQIQRAIQLSVEDMDGAELRSRFNAGMSAEKVAHIIITAALLELEG